MTTAQPRLARTLAAALVAALGVATIAGSAAAADGGELRLERVEESAAGPIDYTAYLPPGYDDSDQEYPTVYLLHGRGDTQESWKQVADDLDELILSGDLQPIIAVMPDAPWNDRGNWYTDSSYTGTASSGTGVAVETAFTQDLVADVDDNFRTIDDREARAVGGYSMGGAGALRFALAHQDMYSAAIALSSAVYSPLPPSDSSTRDYGAFGVGDSLFDEARYSELSYATLLESVDPGLPVHLFIAVGDDEWANPDPEDATHDLDFESAKLYNSARRVSGLTAEFRVLDGGHSWDVWGPAFREGILDVGSRLRTEPTQQWEADQIGSDGDDRAGGVVALDDGGYALAANFAADWSGTPSVGGMDTVLIRRDESGANVWQHVIATDENDRAYGVAPGADDGLIVAGYTRGNLDGEHADPSHDDGYVAGISTEGDRVWTLQTGDPAAADRFYAVASDGAGGAFAAGYTKGSFDGTDNLGDKDAVLAHIDSNGEITWTRQLGGPGEDKALALAASDTGGVTVAGISSGGMPGIENMGENDGWIADFDADGSMQWIDRVATTESDLVAGLVRRPDGSVVAIGQTGGVLGSEAQGDNDIVARAYSPDGDELWTTQVGTASDDRGVTGAAGGDGSVLLVGTTHGAFTSSAGSVDVATIPLALDGTAGEPSQFGSRDRDGADEWDEGNLFASTLSTNDDSTFTAAISGLTYGSVSGAQSAGSGDIFTMTTAWPSAEGTAPTEPASPDPTTAPTPEPTTEPDDGSTSSPATEPAVDPTSEPTTTEAAGVTTDQASGPPAVPTSGTPSGGLLASTGAGALIALVLTATGLLLAGIVFVRRRRLS